jgi:hypothetical protein
MTIVVVGLVLVEIVLHCLVKVEMLSQILVAVEVLDGKVLPVLAVETEDPGYVL